MWQVVQQESATRLLVEKGIFTKTELLGIITLINPEMKRNEK
jgi:hypothetical protein